MSEELKIPAELAPLESQLRCLKTAESSLSRDELLYQSGWAAAMASQSNNPVNSRFRTSWAWPAATGTFATIATVLAVLLLQAGSDRERGIEAFVNVVESNPVKDDASQAKNLAQVVVRSSSQDAGRIERSFDRFHVAYQFPKDGTLTPRSRIDWTNLGTEPVFESGPELESNSKTRFELLRELMPVPVEELERSKPIWDWFSQSLGDVI